MSDFWLLVSVFFDHFPWILLLYMPFVDRLRFSPCITAIINFVVMTGYLLIFKWIMMQPFYNLDIMFVYRTFQLAIILVLVILLVKDYVQKCLFVFGLMFPISICILVWASHTNNYITIIKSATYMDTAVLRIILSAICFPPAYVLWKKYIVPVVKIDNERQWKYAWTIPMIFTIVSLAYTENDFEITYMHFNQVVARMTLCIGVVVISIMQFRAITTAENRVRAEEKAKRSKMLMEMQAEQYNRIAEKIEKTRKSRHDMHHHINVVYQLAKENKTQQLIEYLEEYRNVDPTKEPIVYCDNITVNAIINHYTMLAKEKGITVQLDIALPQKLKIRDTDLCIIIGNLFENAIEAGEKEENKKITLRISKGNNYVYILISNIYSGIIKKEDSNFYSEKREFKEMGIGLSSVKTVVEKYEGRMEIEHTKGEFTVFIMMKNFNGNLT